MLCFSCRRARRIVGSAEPLSPKRRSNTARGLFSIGSGARDRAGLADDMHVGGTEATRVDDETCAQSAVASVAAGNLDAHD